MVEHSVQHHPQPRVMERLTHRRQVIIRAQTGVHMEVIPGVVAVAVAVEYRVEEHRVRAGLLDVLHPVQQAQDAGLRRSVVLLRRAAQPQRIYLINYRLVKPHT